MAYNLATVVVADPITPQGTQHLVVRFSGNAGETSRDFDYTLDENNDVTAGRRWVYDTLARLNARKANVSAVTVGTVVTPLAPSNPVLTNFQIWRNHVQRVLLLNEILDVMTRASITPDPTLLSEIKDELGQINSLYATGFVGQL
jgi:hypothetical protein